MDKKIIEESLQGNAYSLGRLITFLEDWEKRARIIKEIEPYTGKAYILGITGPPGIGKSTLISRLVNHLREMGLTLGLLLVDPTSSISGGALLGDRLRMQEHSLDPGVFIRSLAARDQLGGVSPTTREVIKLLDASGKDIIIVESVGAGQAQVDLRKIADTVVVVSAPGLGDSIQMLKAGLMEIADIFVLNMADREEADRTKRELETAASRFSSAWKPLVITTVATRNEGIAEFYEAVVSHRDFLHKSGVFEQQRRERNLDHTMELVQDLLKKEVEQSLEKISTLRVVIEKVNTGDLDPYSAAGQIVESILHRQPDN
jgi:LAO/AO transport system kinase